VRNSSLVEWCRADNSTGLKPVTEAAEFRNKRPEHGSQMIRSYQDLVVYQQSYQLGLQVHRLTLGFPDFEKYELGSQMRRASKSIPANIAEGYGRRGSEREFKHFLTNAVGSTDEMKVHLNYARDLGYMSETEHQELYSKCEMLARQLVSLIWRWVKYEDPPQ
jgi:four helix bundle protein